MARAPVIGIVTQSAIADDPRVRRQGDAFAAAGWDVFGVGLSGGVSAPTAWPVLTPADLATPAPPYQPPPPRTPLLRRAGSRALGLGRRLGWWTEYEQRLLGVRVAPDRAETVFWTLNSVFHELLALGRTRKADVWLGNDWTSLPMVARLAAEQGAPYGYETHELAADEFDEDPRWRLVQRPIRVAIESRFIRQASIVSTVSQGIAERLRVMHALPEQPLVVRSTPTYTPTPFRPTGDRVRVLYHGVVREHRGLEACVRSVAHWRPEFDLTIRGPCSESYRAALLEEARAAGVQDRVRVVDPVPMTELVREASAFDVGLFALPGHSRHNRYALPNKFFEYVAAGLALCVSDLPEMAALVQRHGLGRLIGDVSPQAIAAALNGFERPTLDEAKRNALAAARELCWERESARMVEAYSALACVGAHPDTRAAG